MAENTNINWREKLLNATKGCRQYCITSWSSLVVEKVWNRGQGLLALFRFYPDKKIVLINSCLFNKSDSKHLLRIKKAIGADDWKELQAEYGYPDYYFKNFNLNLIKNEN